MEKQIVFNLGQLNSTVKQLKPLLDQCSIIAFKGPLGAGKTTLIKELFKECGITDPITSPTFTYMNVYISPTGKRYYHFDLYRLGSLEEFLSMGFDEYLYDPHAQVFIEWPEIIAPLLKKNVCFITLDYVNNDRQLSLTVS